MNKQNVWDQKTEIATVEGPVKDISLEEITVAMKKIKLEKASGLSEVIKKIINASGKVEIDVIMKLCRECLMEKECRKIGKRSVIVPTHKTKGDVTNSGAYKRLKLIKHGMKIVERVLEKRIRALFTIRRMQKEYKKKDKKL